MLCKMLCTCFGSNFALFSPFFALRSMAAVQIKKKKKMYSEKNIKLVIEQKKNKYS